MSVTSPYNAQEGILGVIKRQLEIFNMLHFQLKYLKRSKWWIAARCSRPIYSWYLDLWLPPAHASKVNDGPSSVADRHRAADVCLTNKQRPRETLISRRLLIDLLLINSKTVWFMGKRTCRDSHLARSRVLWMWGAAPGGLDAAVFGGHAGVGNASVHRRSECFVLLRWIQTSSASSALVYEGVAGVWVEGEMSENRKGGPVWGIFH